MVAAPPFPFAELRAREAADPAAGGEPPSDPDASCRSWRDDPDRYIRVVKGGKCQARPHDSLTGERDNLGLFHTRHQARVAIREYWAGKRKGRPKFVHASPFRGGVRYFVRVPATGVNGRRAWVRVGEWFDTPEEAAAAALAHLERAYGRLAAAAMLSRKDTSRRGRHSA